MKKELEEELVRKYPKLYSMYGCDPTKSCMAFGFECRDGWYNLIDELSSKLEPLDVVAFQVKEKYGELRFYTDLVPSEHADKIYKYIDEAEEKSSRTCEICGNTETASPRGRGWVQTICDKCDKR